MIGCKCRICTSSDPRDKRLRSSLMVENNHARVVIDSGPDFRQQMLRENVDSLDAVVFTHEHKDHIAGLDDVRAFNYLQQKAMNVFATDRVQKALQREFHYIFSGENYPGIPKINLFDIHQAAFEVEGIRFEPIPVMHMQLPVLGFRIGNFSYVTDANYISDASAELLKNSDVLVINALRKEKHVSHFTLDEALEVIDSLKPKRAFLTHISHQLGLQEEIDASLPAHVKCAYDGLKIEL